MTLHEILVLVHFFFLLSLFSLLFDFVVNKSTENGAMKLESYFHQFLLFFRVKWLTPFHDRNDKMPIK